MDQIRVLLTEWLGPQGTQLLAWIYWNAVEPLFSQPTLHWFFILSTVVVAWLFYVAHRAGPERWSLREFFRYLFPKSIYTHPSAIVDYKFYVVTQFVLTHLRLGQWVVGLAALLYVAEGIVWLLEAVFGPRPETSASPSFLVAAVFTLAMALAYDYARFLGHYLHHRVPVLWEFHKVHHSAEVLTPISSFRAHPVDQMIEALLRVIATAAVSGAFSYFYPNGIKQLTILNYGALTFLFYVTAHLRHSHVPLDFGPLDRVFVSPLMHQLHHSAQREHFDKNFGFIFSFWDRLAGTYYVPAKDERFTLGLPEEAGRYDSVRALYFRPFVEAARLLTKSRPSLGGA